MVIKFISILIILLIASLLLCADSLLLLRPWAPSGVPSVIKLISLGSLYNQQR